MGYYKKIVYQFLKLLNKIFSNTKYFIIFFTIIFIPLFIIFNLENKVEAFSNTPTDTQIWGVYNSVIDYIDDIVINDKTIASIPAYKDVQVSTTWLSTSWERVKDNYVCFYRHVNGQIIFYFFNSTNAPTTYVNRTSEISVNDLISFYGSYFLEVSVIGQEYNVNDWDIRPILYTYNDTQNIINNVNNSSGADYYEILYNNFIIKYWNGGQVTNYKDIYEIISPSNFNLTRQTLEDLPDWSFSWLSGYSGTSIITNDISLYVYYCPSSDYKNDDFAIWRNIFTAKLDYGYDEDYLESVNSSDLTFNFSIPRNRISSNVIVNNGDHILIQAYKNSFWSWQTKELIYNYEVEIGNRDSASIITDKDDLLNNTMQNMNNFLQQEPQNTDNSINSAFNTMSQYSDNFEDNISPFEKLFDITKNAFLYIDEEYPLTLQVPFTNYTYVFYPSDITSHYPSTMVSLLNGFWLYFIGLYVFSELRNWIMAFRAGSFENVVKGGDVLITSQL